MPPGLIRFFQGRHPRRVFPFLLALLAVYLIKQTIFSSKTPLPQPQAIPSALPAVLLKDQPTTERVRPSQSLSAILMERGVRPDDARFIIESLRAMGSALLFPGQEYSVSLRPDSTLGLFSLRSRDRKSVHEVTREAGQYRASLRILPRRVDTLALSGTLTTSLYEAMALAGEKPELIVNMIDIFAWDINWFSDPQPGDTFRLAYEKIFCAGEFMGYGRILSACYSNRGRRITAYRFGADSGAGDYFNAEGVSLRKSLLKAPLSYSRISSRFSYSRLHPILKCRRPHLGVDYAAPVGTPVKSAGDGRVTFAGVQGGYGKSVTIRHFNSYASLYGHLSSLAPGIRNGARVTQGQVIGYVGKSGLSTGPHLDYRLKRGEHFVNPLNLTTPPVSRIPDGLAGRFNAIRFLCDRTMGIAGERMLYASHQ